MKIIGEKVKKGDKGILQISRSEFIAGKYPEDGYIFTIEMDAVESGIFISKEDIAKLEASDGKIEIEKSLLPDWDFAK